MAPTVAILTQIPSPYQAELFDALAESGRVRPRVIYLFRQDVNRLWDCPSLAHEHVISEDGAVALAAAQKWIDDSDLAVFSCYSDYRARELMRRRAASGRPWCLWGERPGGRWGVLGRLRRRLFLAPLARSRAPIWGMGKWAVAGWQREFGNKRSYENVPYFSNTYRFKRAARASRPGTRTVLFSGSLILRKGVDLLAEAFKRVATDRPNLRLDLLGTGELEAGLRRRLEPIREQVRFLGFQQWADLPMFYRAADVLCAPSRYDGWGLIVPEALAAGLPVIATDQMGAAIDLVCHGVNGWLIRASSMLDLQCALHQLADLSDKQLDEMSRQAMETAAGHTLQDGVHRFCGAVSAALACHR